MKWGLIGLGGLLATAAVALAIGYGWLRSDGGREWLARQIEEAASTPGEMELAIGSLDGDLPAQIRLRDIVLRDADGAWLTIDALDLDWRPWALLSRTLEVESLALSGVDLARLPAAPAAAEDDSDSDGGLQSLPVKVRLGRLAADEIALGAPVFGQAARFTLAGEARSRDDGSLAAEITLERLDGPEATLRARLDYDPAADSLIAEIDAAEAPGGLLATLLETPDLPRAEMTLNGSGPLNAWDGDFTLSLGEVAQAEAAIGLERSDSGDLGFRLDGQTTISPPARADAWALLAGRTEIRLAGAWQGQRRLHLENFTAANDALRISARGDAEPESGVLDLSLSAATETGTALAGLLGLDRLDSLSADVALSGTLGAPRAEISLRAAELATPDFEAAAIAVDGEVTARNDLSGSAPALALDLTGRVDAPRLPGAAEINQVLGASIPLALRGGLDLDTAVLDIAALEATLDAAQLSASGPFDLDDGAAQLEAALAVDDLAALQPLTEITLGGAARLAGPLTLRDYGGTIEAELTGRWERPASDIGLIAAAGNGLDLAVRLAVAGGEVRIDDLIARSPASELSAALTIAGAELRDGRYRLTLADAAVLADALGTDISGPARVEGRVSGPFDALNLAGDVQAESVTLAGQTLSGISADYDLRLSGADIDGPVGVALTSAFGQAEARGDLRLRADAVTLANLQARLPQATVAGDVVVPLDGGEPQAELHGEFADLAPWLAFADLEGGGQGKVMLQWNRPGTAAPLLATAELSALSLRPAPDAAPLRVDRLTLDLRARDPALSDPATFTIGAETLTWERLALARLDLDGEGTLDDLELRLAAAGEWIEPLDLTAAARVTQAGDAVTVVLREARGTAFGQPLTLRDTATLALAPGETRLEGLDLASGDTRLTAEARLGGEELSATARLEALPFTTVDAFWDSGLDGLVSARLNLEGPRDDPRGSASLTAGGLRPRGAGELPELALTSSAEWRDGRVVLEGRLGGAEVTEARFTAEAPLRLTTDGGGLEVPQDGALSGALDWRGGLDTVLLFVPLPQHRLGGNAEVALTVGGTLAAPKLDGSLVLADGRYENLETGTVLRDLALRAEVNEDRVTLAGLTANDGAGGRVTGDGAMQIDPARQFPFDASIQLNEFRALHRDDVTAVASGTVELSGDTQAPRVKGRFTTETVEISLLTQLPPEVVTLDVIEVRNGVVQAEPPEAEDAPAVDAALDIVIDMPRRVFVRGRGLDSEWAGRISVQGRAAEPVISGEVNLVRGQLSVIGKTFRLREGKVILPRSGAGEATLDVTAVHQGRNLEVTAHMTGPITQPSLELSSNPQVPRDEIISRVLFNKSAAELSPAEAAQLALALRDLSGQGGGTDVLGFARRTLGVDVLRVDTTAEGEAALEAGRYLADGVYVGVKQGATEQSGGAEVEVELTPNITLESEVTGSGASKSGVRFQLDY